MWIFILVIQYNIFKSQDYKIINFFLVCLFSQLQDVRIVAERKWYEWLWQYRVFKMQMLSLGLAAATLATASASGQLPLPLSSTISSSSRSTSTSTMTPPVNDTSCCHASAHFQEILSLSELPLDRLLKVKMAMHPYTREANMDHRQGQFRTTLLFQMSARGKS